MLLTAREGITPIAIGISHNLSVILECYFNIPYYDWYCVSEQEWASWKLLELNGEYTSLFEDNILMLVAYNFSLHRCLPCVYNIYIAVFLYILSYIVLIYMQIKYTS